MDAIDCILTRRSIRRYKPEPLPEGALERIIELASWAPSWANTQCVRYIAISGPLKEQLVILLGTGNKATVISQAPVVLAVCVIHGLSGALRDKPENEKGEAWTYFDCGGAVQTLCLAAHALGYGTLQIGAFNYESVGDLLDIPVNLELMELVAIGTADINPAPPARLSVNELLSYK